jgi:hypothetical protein
MSEGTEMIIGYFVAFPSPLTPTGWRFAKWPLGFDPKPVTATTKELDYLPEIKHSLNADLWGKSLTELAKHFKIEPRKAARDPAPPADLARNTLKG